MPKKPTNRKPSKAGKKPAKAAKASAAPPTRARSKRKPAAKLSSGAKRLAALADQIAALRAVARGRRRAELSALRAGAPDAGGGPVAAQALSDAQILAGVIEVVKGLTAVRPVTAERRLGDLNVPLDPLARQLNAAFFGGADVLGAEQFNGGQTVGTVAYIVAITLEAQ